MNEFMQDKQTVLEGFNTHPDLGLSETQTKQNREKFGANALTPKKKDSLLKRIISAAGEPMIIMLIAAGLIALGVNLVRAFSGGEADFWECAGVFAAIALSVGITVIMEGKSARAFEELSKLSNDTWVRVIRGGETKLIAQREIVAGDIVCLETGDKAPADGRLLESVSLYLDEAMLTGESKPSLKNADAVYSSENTPLADRQNLVYSGCFVTGGSGKMVVTATGDRTELGKIAGELSLMEKSSTPLQEKLGKLGKVITLLGVSAAALVFIIQLIIFIANGTASLDTVSEAFITSIVLIVAAVPEGLPTIVAVSLSVNIIKMSKQNALVKKMIACETVGCINVICSDKTGTLTENRMTVTDIGAGGKAVAADKLESGHMLVNFCLNSTADVNFDEKPFKFIGNPTECALLTAAHKSGFDYKKLRAGYDIVYVYPFSSETKDMTTVISTNGEMLAYTKGSPEKILSMCDISPADKAEVESQILAFQQRAKRVIAFAHKKIESTLDFAAQREVVESGMEFDGFTAISDPLRADVYDSVASCKRAGIELKMLTGDNLATAKAIAEELGILSGEAVEAAELEGLSDGELAQRLGNIKVIARSTPIIKMRVVKALKALGNVVAVTGDGINDAPAIKNADVGVAMGVSGTEVSKEASDIVLLDDSFSTIVKSVQWGRGIYENFQRFIQFQLTVNLSSVIVVLMSILLGFKSPFSALQLLWINIIMDGPPALTLGLEPIRGDLLGRAPTKRNASIVTKDMLMRIAFNGVFIAAVFLSQQAFNFMDASAEQLPTVLFTLFVVFQLFNSFNSRELDSTSIFKNIAKNKLMLVVVWVTFMLQVVITQFGGLFFGTTPLPFSLWVKLVLTALSVIALSELFRLILRIWAKKHKN